MYPEKSLSKQGRAQLTRMTPSPGIEPGPHWWEASALTTAPPLAHVWLCSPYTGIMFAPVWKLIQYTVIVTF